MCVLFSRPTMVRFAARVALVTSCAAMMALVGNAGQGRTPADRVYSDSQAVRGEQAYQAQCANCHGNSLEGDVGPPLAGPTFLSIWSRRPLADLVEKIVKTMPPQQAGSVSVQQAIDLAAYALRASGFPAGQAELSSASLTQLAFPAVDTSPLPAGTAGPSFAAAGNLAQVMRAVTFPNANILFNVQVKDPGKEKPSMPIPFDYVAWGSTVYYGWQAVDQAALALVETTPLFLVPGRRCENGRPVPVERADFRQYTMALVDVGRAAYRAAQTRNIDAVIAITAQLNDSCASCHKVYRDGAREGNTAGGARCR